MEINWRVLLGLVIIAAVSISFFTTGFDFEGISGFSIFPVKGPVKNITISASIRLKDIEFSAPIEKLTLQLYSQQNEILIGDQKIDLSSQSIVELENFNGKITIKNNKLSVNGKAEKVMVNDVSMKHKTGMIKFLADGINYQIVSAEKIILSPTRYEKAEGYAYINNDKFYVQFNNEPLELGAFKGTLELTESEIALNGIVDKIFVDGESKFLIDE